MSFGKLEILKRQHEKGKLVGSTIKLIIKEEFNEEVEPSSA